MMQPTFAGSPRTARSIGLGDRFRYWRGASGRRYLFSLMPADVLDDLHNVVLIEATLSPCEPEPKPVWIGEVDTGGEKHGWALSASSGRLTRTFAHFIDGSEQDRHAAMLDLVGGRA
jgi:hypothetical protein